MTPITKCEVCGSFVRIEGTTIKRYVPNIPRFPTFEEMADIVEAKHLKGEHVTIKNFYYWLKEWVEMK